MDLFFLSYLNIPETFICSVFWVVFFAEIKPYLLVVKSPTPGKATLNHEAQPPPSKGGGQDGDIGVNVLDSSLSCWSLSNITAPLLQQLNEKKYLCKR